IDPARNRLHARVAGVAIEGNHVRVHGEHLVAGVLQALVDQVPGRVVAVHARHARDRDALQRQEVVHAGFERLHGFRPPAAAAQIVARSLAVSRASGWSIVYAPPGIFPIEASRHDAISSSCCWAGEYDAHSEKLIALRPWRTALAITKDRGGTRVYQGHA